MDFSNTLTMLAAINQTNPATSFLRDRYFPTNPATDIFNTSEVLVEYRDGNKKLAPFVSPKKNGIVSLRDGYNTHSYAPANIAPKRPITIDDLQKKGFGEALFSNLTPEQRQLALILRDVAEMDEMTTRREEVVASETMRTNGCVMKHYADKNDEYKEKEIHFYDGASNPSTYTPSIRWDQSGANIIGDIDAMIKMLTSKGNAATDVILGGSVAKEFMNNDGIQKLLDLRNYNIGSVAPIELPIGAARLANLNIMGHQVNILTYDQTYEADNGTDTPYIPTDAVIVTAPAAGRTVYGAVTQVEQSDGAMHTYPGRRVPHYVADAANNTRSITLTSCPLLMPNKKNPWVSAEVM